MECLLALSFPPNSRLRSTIPTPNSQRYRTDMSTPKHYIHEDERLSLLIPELNRRRIFFGGIYKSPRLQDLLTRFDKGWLPYTNCTNQELATYIRQRGLLPAPDANLNREHLVEQLETADDEWTFAPYFNLPAELRKVILRFILSAAPIDPIDTYHRQANHQVAAITRASRQLRSEALPIFYNVNTFILKPGLFNTNRGVSWKRGREWDYFAQQKTWLRSIVKHDVVHLSRIVFQMNNQDCDGRSTNTLRIPGEAFRPCVSSIVVEIVKGEVQVYMDQAASCKVCRGRNTAVKEIQEHCQHSSSNEAEAIHFSIELIRQIHQICEMTRW